MPSPTDTRYPMLSALPETLRGPVVPGAKEVNCYAWVQLQQRRDGGAIAVAVKGIARVVQVLQAVE